MAFGSLMITLDDLGLLELKNITNSDPQLISDGIFLFSLIYFIIDLYLMIKYHSPKYNIYFFHHGIGIISLLVAYGMDWDQSKYVMHYLTFELSTPCYNLLYALQKRGYTSEDKIFYLIQWIFVFTFTIVRVIFGTYTTFHLVQDIFANDMISNYYVILPISLQILMYYWFRSIIIKIRRSQNIKKHD